MAKVLDFKPVKNPRAKTKPASAKGGKANATKTEDDAKRLIQIANEIDGLILGYLQKPGVDPIDVAGVLAHRLGTLLSHLEEKAKLWDVCERVLKKQAKLDDVS